MSTDFAVHTREQCSRCALNGDGCACSACKSLQRFCGMGTLLFPMMSSCKWNSILQCVNFKEKPRDGISM